MLQPAFRLATTADIAALIALVTSAYRGDASRAGWTTEADLLDGNRIDADLLAADLARERSEILVAHLDGTPVGCVHIEERADVGYFGMFAVDPQRQGSGIGRQVMSAAEEYAAQTWGVATMEMTVISQRAELIAYYGRRGYRRTGDHVPFPYGDARFGSPRRDDLIMDVLRKPLTA